MFRCPCEPDRVSWAVNHVRLSFSLTILQRQMPTNTLWNLVIHWFDIPKLHYISTISCNDIKVKQKHMSGGRNVLPKFMPISLFRWVSHFKVFQTREFKEMLAISDLALQACISFLEAFQTRVAHFCFCLVGMKCRCTHVTLMQWNDKHED